MKKYIKASQSYLTAGIALALIIFSILFTPWICLQNKIIKKTYEQNLRIERKLDTLKNRNKIIEKKVDSTVIKVDSNRAKVDSVLKKHKK